VKLECKIEKLAKEGGARDEGKALGCASMFKIRALTLCNKLDEIARILCFANARAQNIYLA
jgi:hypothetical protein